MKKIVLFLIGALLAAAPAFAQGPPTPPPFGVLAGTLNAVAVNNGSTRTALPSSAVSANAVTILNTGSKDIFIKLGDVTVTATTSSTVIHPSIPVVIYSGAATNIAAITGGTDTSTFTLYQGNGPILARAGGGAGGTPGSCTGAFCTAGAPLSPSLGGTGQSALGTGVGTALAAAADGTGGFCLVGGTGCPGGSGAVSSVTGANGVACSPTTGSVNCNGTFPSKPITGAYTILTGDGGVQLVLNSGSAIPLTIAAAGSAGFTAGSSGGFAVPIFGKGAGTGTVTPASGTVNGAASGTIAQNQDCLLSADPVTSTNYILSCYTLGGAGAVSSVFGRTGAVVAATNDYSFSQINGLLGLSSQVSGILPSANGGAGTVSGIMTANGSGATAALNIGANLSYNSGTNTLSATAGGTGCVTSGSAGNPLTDNGSGGCTSNSTLPINKLATIAANTLLGNSSGSTASPSALAVNSGSSCGDSTHALNWLNGTGLGCQTLSGSGGVTPTITVFNTSGSNTFTTKTGSTLVRMLICGGGGGGGGGDVVASATAGAAGGGAGCFDRLFKASDFCAAGSCTLGTDTAAFSVAAGGTHGAANANGSIGGNTTVTLNGVVYTAYGGGFGAVGTAANSKGGGGGDLLQAGPNGGSNGFGGTGGSGVAGGSPTAPMAGSGGAGGRVSGGLFGGEAWDAGPGGGAGGGLNFTGGNGGQGIGCPIAAVGGALGTSGGTAPGPLFNYMPGCGGAGGGGSTAGTAGSGSNGTQTGGGGGGGSAGIGGTAGAGGDGGVGLAVIWTW